MLLQRGCKVIVATAGHIDHGKTLLVKTLTGVDTDRLPEEKARGISIDLGFAYLSLPDAQAVGFVDVPGHERFIRNMLAGVCGIDYALLVVAADDGVMPQTVEHLHILDLLNVAHGAAVITKTDRVDAARVSQVADNVRALLAPTRLANASVLPVSAVSGSGIAELRQLLAGEAALLARRQAAGQHFRYAIDRAFSVAGSGTVVTGTVFNGMVKTNDKLVVSPAGQEVRVRGIQIQGKAAGQAAAGQRCALNLTGADLASVSRGDWVLAAAIHRPTRRLDVRITTLPGEGQALKHWTPLHLHLATADVTARIAIRRGETIAPGTSAIAQLVLDKPVAALHGDRFILRDQSASRTRGGGVVLDPLPPAARLRGTSRPAELAALEQPGPQAVLAALAAQPDRAVDLAHFDTIFNLLPEHAAQLRAQVGIVQLGKDGHIGIPAARHAALRDAILAHVRDFHRAQPQAAGQDVESMRVALAADLPQDAYASLLRGLADEHKLEVSGSTARLPGHNPTANTADEKLWQAVRPALLDAGYNVPPLRELSAQLKLKEALVKDFLHRKARGGDIMKVTADRFYPRATLAALAAVAQATAQTQAGGQFTAAQYRDATGIGRGLAIEILEFLDSLGITQRVGDARKMRKDYLPILGEAVIPPNPPAARPAAKSAPAPQRRPLHHTRR